MTNPYNTATVRTLPDVIEFEPPPAEETGRFRVLIDLHRTDPEKYLEKVRHPSRPNPA